jgi:hypothetical protein
MSSGKIKGGGGKERKAMADIQTSVSQQTRQHGQIFCDLDGVLVDFERGVLKLTGRPPYKGMWPRVHQQDLHFYRDLEWTADGNELWEAIWPLRPNILTGVTTGSTVKRDKFEWCKRELCVEVNWRDMAAPGKTHQRVENEKDKDDENDRSLCTVITCWSANKHLECRDGDILIDDRPDGHDLQENWEDAGGIFIHHVSTEQTLRELRELGILPDVASTTLAVECDTSAHASDEGNEQEEEK